MNEQWINDTCMMFQNTFKDIHNVANRETDPMDITDYSGQDIVCDYFMTDGQEPDDYCSKAEPKERTGEQ